MVFVASAGLGGAALIGGGALASGVLGYFGSQQASQAQVGAEQQGLAAQNQARSQLNPFINAGAGAAGVLGGLTGANGQQPNFSAFANSPDYLFAQQQGNSALQNYLNANGMARSGGGITAAINYNQGLASQQYGNYFNRLMQIATLGGNAAQAGVGGANAAANTIGNIGQSQASGIVGGTNAVTGSLNSGINNSLLYNALNHQGSPSGYAPTQQIAFNPQQNQAMVNAYGGSS